MWHLKWAVTRSLMGVAHNVTCSFTSWVTCYGVGNILFSIFPGFVNKQFRLHIYFLALGFATMVWASPQFSIFCFPSIIIFVSLSWFLFFYLYISPYHMCVYNDVPDNQFELIFCLLKLHSRFKSKWHFVYDLLRLGP